MEDLYCEKEFGISFNKIIEEFEEIEEHKKHKINKTEQYIFLSLSSKLTDSNCQYFDASNSIEIAINLAIKFEKTNPRITMRFVQDLFLGILENKNTNDKVLLTITNKLIKYTDIYSSDIIKYYINTFLYEIMEHNNVSEENIVYIENYFLFQKIQKEINSELRPANILITDPEAFNRTPSPFE